MNVVWTRNASRQLRAIHDYVAATSSRYAQSLVDRITKKTQILETQPHLGAEVPEYQDESVRELLEHPYRIIYRVHDDRVEILSVIHGARQLPDVPGGP